jgi:predicted amidohydrolase YtcJ
MVFAKALIGRKILKNVRVEIEGGYIRKVEVTNEGAQIPGILIPSFVDTHAHYLPYSLSLTRPRLDGIGDLKSALDFIAENVKKVPHNVIIMEGFDDSKWERSLTREDLDRITERPLVVRRVCGHKAVLNTSAIKILKERFGEIPNLNEETGLAVEDLPLALSKYFPPGEEEIEDAIMRAEDLLISMGIWVVGENASIRYLRKLVEMDRAGMLKIRWRVAVYFNQIDEAKKIIKYESENFRVVGIKEFLDGSVGARTAAFSRGYTDGGNGKLLKSDEELEKIMKTADSMNMGVKLSLQPNFVRRWGEIGGLYHRALGEVFFWGNRFRLLENLKANYAFGSDTMPPGPIYGILGALYHPIKEERLGLEEALYRYTTAGAEILGEREFGEIAPGKKALITVITEDFNP